ncbi:hypothetical protein J8C06_09635 [Chloracidobacterium validum]|uniref:Uncharacterized protein n=1 Tax=Chloracidobacterium validum TaxID=2821543 RepID=A0ABX8B6Q4_9BACT|nr:hypothetical protein [Chloracidobacterium validum]QUW02598.1 hypothetical protein J8C06_09635 [Chloracidobacterium validum]
MDPPHIDGSVRKFESSILDSLTTNFDNLIERFSRSDLRSNCFEVTLNSRLNDHTIKTECVSVPKSMLDLVGVLAELNHYIIRGTAYRPCGAGCSLTRLVGFLEPL